LDPRSRYLDIGLSDYWRRTLESWASLAHTPLIFFYEIRSTTGTVLKRDGGFASQDAAKMAAREEAKKLKKSRLPNRPDVGGIMV
jgi:hypothetical protein